jgi:hypothetical protein
VCPCSLSSAGDLYQLFLRLNSGVQSSNGCTQSVMCVAHCRGWQAARSHLSCRM